MEPSAELKGTSPKTATPVAAALAHALGSELLLLRVVAPETPTSSREAAAQERQETQAEAEAYLEQVAVQIRERGLPVTVMIDSIPIARWRARVAVCTPPKGL